MPHDRPYTRKPRLRPVPLPYPASVLPASYTYADAQAWYDRYCRDAALTPEARYLTADLRAAMEE